MLYTGEGGGHLEKLFLFQVKVYLGGKSYSSHNVLVTLKFTSLLAP